MLRLSVNAPDVFVLGQEVSPNPYSSPQVSYLMSAGLISAPFLLVRSVSF